jgi:HlyD family secretion protein
MGTRTVAGRSDRDSRHPSRHSPVLREVREAPTIAQPAERSIQELPVERKRRRRLARNWLIVGLLAISAIVGGYIWRRLSPPPLPAGIAVSNGRLEAIHIDIATKLAGRIEAVLVHEGDFVESSQIVARMDTSVLRAQLREAEAQLAKARTAVATANAVVAQRGSELALAESVLKRSEQLAQGGFVSSQKLDTDRSQLQVAKATLTASQSQVAEGRTAVSAAEATIERIVADIDDSVLRAPTAGRIQYRLAEPGEVLSAGGRVVSMLNLADVYMTVFLPETTAGKLVIGAEARLVFDAAPQYVVPAHVTFVAAEAQFTPKTVETSTERQKLVFRVKAQIDPQLLRRYWTRVKAGMPGIAYVRVDPAARWPDRLAIHLPPQ